MLSASEEEETVRLTAEFIDFGSRNLNRLLTITRGLRSSVGTKPRDTMILQKCNTFQLDFGVDRGYPLDWDFLSKTALAVASAV